MNTRTAITLLTALALMLPAAMTFTPTEAFAAGGVLKSSRSGGKRTHKRAGAKRTKSSKKKKKSKKSKTTRRTSTRTTRTTRPTTTTTRRTRTTHTHTAHRSARTTRVVHHPHSTRTVSHRTRHVHRSAPTRTRTVHHHHGSRRSGTVTKTSTQSSGGSNVDVYITGGLGMSGFESTTISDQALPGVGWGVAVGGKGKLLGFELGLDGGGFTFDEESNQTDLAYFGLYGDLRVQPTFGILEPFALAGLAGYSLQDGVLQEATGGAAFRLGLGANIRFDDFAIGGKYLYTGMAFADDSGIYGGDFSAKSESVTANVTFYF